MCSFSFLPTSGLIRTPIISMLAIMPLYILNIKSMCGFYITIQSSSSYGMAHLNGRMGTVGMSHGLHAGQCKVDGRVH